MTDSPSNKILASVAADDFIGRARELDALRRHAADENGARGLLLLSAPAVGASELLKQNYDWFFREQNSLIPFYFAVKPSDRTAKNCAARFLQTFIAQTNAFRRRDARILAVAPDACELVELAAAGDAGWIERLVAACRIESRLNDERAFIRSCLSAPLRAAAEGARALVMIDDLHETDFFSGDVDVIEEIKAVLSRSTVPFVLAGRRRFLLNAARTGTTKLNGAEILPLEPLDFSDAGFLTENLAAKYALAINEPTRDLIARQLQGKPTFINFLMQAANERRVNLDSFRRAEQIYADELFGGRIGKFYESLLDRIVPDGEAQKELVGLFYQSLTAENKTAASEVWQTRFGTAGRDFQKIIRLLHAHEIVRQSSGSIEMMAENEVLGDYATARFRLENKGEKRAAVVGELLAQFIKRAPRTMAKFYREKSAIGLRELLAIFDGQAVPRRLLDFAVYKERLQKSETAETIEDEREKITLPRVVFTAHTAAFYPPFEKLTEAARSAIGIADAGEAVWLAAEIDSKLEASKEKAEFWCDRLEMVALACNFQKYKIWLVAPEGFAPEASEILEQRNAFGASRRQIERLTEFLKTEIAPPVNAAAEEYEFVLPMREDIELIAANAVEEIARRQGFVSKAVNQIKTALVEACINATEHSLSPDRKIHLKIAVENDRLVLAVANRGLRLADKKPEESAPAENRRGWGLKLMRSLMDEVSFERVDDGTRLSMTKYLTSSKKMPFGG